MIKPGSLCWIAYSMHYPECVGRVVTALRYLPEEAVWEIDAPWMPPTGSSEYPHWWAKPSWLVPINDPGADMSEEYVQVLEDGLRDICPV